MDALPPGDLLVMQVAKMIREVFFHQNAFDVRDTYTSLKKQFIMLDLILHYYQEAQPAFQSGVVLNQLLALPVLEEISRAKLIAESELAQLDVIKETISKEIAALSR